MIGGSRQPFAMSPAGARTSGRTRSNNVCPPVREVLDRVGDKWSVLVIALLGGGTRRFSELRRSIEGISQRMLTLTLRGLERDGLVLRTLHPTIPARVDYELTAEGRTLLEPVLALCEWAHQHRSVIHEARRRHDAAASARPASARAAADGEADFFPSLVEADNASSVALDEPERGQG